MSNTGFGMYVLEFEFRGGQKVSVLYTSLEDGFCQVLRSQEVTVDTKVYILVNSHCCSLVQLLAVCGRRCAARGRTSGKMRNDSVLYPKMAIGWNLLIHLLSLYGG